MIAGILEHLKNSPLDSLMLGCSECEAVKFQNPGDTLPCDQCVKDNKEIEEKLKGGKHTAESFEDIFQPHSPDEISKRVIKYIEEVCTKNSDNTYSSKKSVDLSDMNLTRLPVKFKEVSGDFYCIGNQLTTLEGAPERVYGGSFNCDNNQLTASKLKKTVKRDYL